MRRTIARWRSHAHQVAERCATWRGQWRVQRELERAVAGDGPIVAGPWCSEVGYEVLYWIPFLRWVMAAYRIRPERVVVVSRGGVSAWYDGIAGRYVEIFDAVDPSELAARAAEGLVKQRGVADFDRSVAERALQQARLPVPERLLHPSLMFRWFAPFWSGHESLGFVERHTRYRLMSAPEIDLPMSPPAEYAVVKCYSSRALPDRPDVRAQLRAVVDALSERLPVVHLDTGLGVDEHADFALGGGQPPLGLRGRVHPSTNLAVQTKLVAGARLFVGTCGSLAWLAPLLGVPAVPLFADDSLLHAHLHVARRVYTRVGAASFSPIDLTGVATAGLRLGAAGPSPVRAHSA